MDGRRRPESSGLIEVHEDICEGDQKEGNYKCLLCVCIMTDMKHRKLSNVNSHVFSCRPQASRDPLPPDDMNKITEDVKDMGVLIGKGGIYGQVPALTFCLVYLLGLHVVKNTPISES